MKKIFLLKASVVLALVMLCSGAMAQKTIRGVVTDGITSETLPGAHVLLRGTTHGVATDYEGRYEIEVPDEAQELEVSLIGYQTRVVEIGDRLQINIALFPATTQLDEVVITGYGGTQLRSKLTNSISTVREEVLATGMYSNPARALSGAVSGLRVTQGSGRPGSVPAIVLRGGTNLDGSGAPLVLVDGQVRTISDINPEDIESIEVLKDAGATALYGARANNGVILITTKRGSAGVSEINVKVRNGFNYLNQPFDFMNAEDYLTWARTGVQKAGNYFQTNDGTWTGHGAGVQASLNGAQPYGLGNVYFDGNGNPVNGNETALGIWSPMVLNDDNSFLLGQGWQTMIDPITGQEIIFYEFDRAASAFNNPAQSRDLNISMSGGNDRGGYYAGIGFQQEDGLPVNSWYQRLNFLFNGDYQIRDWIKSSSSLSFNNARWDNGVYADGNYFGRMLSAPPTQREYNHEGELLLGTNFGDGNPLVNKDQFIRNNQSDKFTMIQALTFDLYEGLSFRVTANLMYDEAHSEAFNRDYLANPGVWNRTRSSSAQFSRTTRQTYNAVFNYDTQIAQNHTLSLLAGSEFYDTYNKGLYAAGSGAPTDDFMDLQYTSNDEGMRNIDSWHVRERILSYFGRANYDYMDKYLLSFTFRQDGYSKLLGDNQWGFFPGVSGGWVMSRESFMENLEDILSFVKLRASYGLNGNVSGVGSYELQGSYSSNIYGGNIGYLVGAIPNPGLRWERSNTFEVGTDIGFLQNQIITNFTYYNRLTKDKYASIPLPVSSGLSSIRSNNGEFRNEGFELDLIYRVMRRKDFSWDINANISYNINTVVKLPDNGLDNNRQGAFQVYDPVTGEVIWVGGYQEGQRPGGLWVFQAEGIFQNWDQVNAVAGNRMDYTSGNNGSNGRPLYGPGLWDNMTDAERANGLPIQPGDIIWKDVNGDGIIDDRDLVYVGNVNPKFFGGISTNFAYKGLQLIVRTDFALDYKQLDNIRPWFMGMMQGSFNTLEETKDTWTPDNPNASYPTYMWADQLGKRNYARPSSMFVYDASYLAFREVTLLYALPQGLINALGDTKIEFSATGLNLGYWTKSKLHTPEVTGTGGVGAGYGLPRSFIFGVNVKF